MSWGRVDDKLRDNPKFVAIHDPKNPTAVWLAVLSWALGDAARKSPGFVPTAIALRDGKPSALRTLVNVGLWHEVDGGYEIHDFADYAERPAGPRSEVGVSDVSAKRREAGRKGGLARAAKQTPTLLEANGQANTQANQANASARARAPDPDPDPDPEEREKAPPPPVQATEPDPWGLSGGAQTVDPPPVAPKPCPSSPNASTSPVVAPAGRPGVAAAPPVPEIVRQVRDLVLRDAGDLVGKVDPDELVASSQRMCDRADNTVRSSKATVPLLVGEAVTRARRWRAERQTHVTPERALAEIEAKMTWVLGEIDARKFEPPKRATTPTEEKWGGVTKY